MSLARQALTGVFWTAAERFGLQAIQLTVVIVLARKLTPEDFGLVAMLMVVFTVSSVLVNGGFTAGLIREPEITEEDKASAFWMNLITSVVMYGVIWAAAPAIARFFEEPRLVELTRFMALNLVFLALTLVQVAELSHRLEFRRLGIANLAAAVLTGVVAVWLAAAGAGVWALAARFVLGSASASIFLWIALPWHPRHWISRRSLRKLFAFGSRLAASGLLDEAFQNVYKVLIGKYFAAATLGFYQQAQTFQRTASQSLAEMLQRVTYPILAKTKDDAARLKRGYRSMIQVSSFVIFPAMVGMALTAEPLLLTLVGEKWRPATPFLQLLCISGALYHLHGINLNVLKVVGRTDLFLKLEVIKKTNICIAIVIGWQFGIWGLLAGQVVSSYVALFINMYYTRRFIDYSIREQLRDILAVLWLSAPMSLVVWAIGSLWQADAPVLLGLMACAGAATYVATALMTDATPFRLVRDLLVPRLAARSGVSA